MKGWIALMLGALMTFFAGSGLAEEKQIVGWIEKVRVYPGNVLMHAKVDTGADHSYIHAINISEFDRDGERWVRFCIAGAEGREPTVECKVQRTAKIKRHGGPRLERYVVLLGICLGKYFGKAEVNLVDRSHFKYPLLIGRSFMQHHVLVDPGRTYLTEPDCQEASPR